MVCCARRLHRDAAPATAGQERSWRCWRCSPLGQVQRRSRILVQCHHHPRQSRPSPPPRVPQVRPRPMQGHRRLRPSAPAHRSFLGLLVTSGEEIGLSLAPVRRRSASWFACRTDLLRGRRAKSGSQLVAERTGWDTVRPVARLEGRVIPTPPVKGRRTAHPLPSMRDLVRLPRHSKRVRWRRREADASFKHPKERSRGPAAFTTAGWPVYPPDRATDT